MQPKRPFLKWAGAKTKLLHAIRAVAPTSARRFVEPFVGSGTVALNLGHDANILADANGDLIAVFAALQQEGDSFIDCCEPFFTAANNSSESYYALREEFNATSDLRRKAALFVFLNRHSYNGLCRYNAKGKFNAPFGRYVGPRFPRQRMQAFHTFLQSCEVRHADFRQVLADTGPGDFVYCDPPYIPMSPTARFTSYAQHGFRPEDQVELVACCRAAAERGACVVISNHDTPVAREIYREADHCVELLVPRRISCDGENRHDARELLVVFQGRSEIAAALPSLVSLPPG